MCNCGHEGCEPNEADRLRKRAVLFAAAAACMTALPALFVTSDRTHHLLLVAVVAVQALLLLKALHLMRQRRHLSQATPEL